MKRILLASAMIISSFGMMNLQTVSAQGATQNNSPMVRAKALVSKINQVVFLRDDEWSKVNTACVEYYQELDKLNAAKPADLDAKVAELKKTRDAKIKASLKQDQLASWATFKD